tara:strand:+ start:699 stop:926 length:228 start_codon:yes stop_codon:yes gene_type:complete
MIDIRSKIRGVKAFFFNGIFMVINLPIVLLFGLTLLLMLDGIPRLVKQLDINSSTVWNFSIVAMGTMTVIIYLSK